MKGDMWEWQFHNKLFSSSRTKYSNQHNILSSGKQANLEMNIQVLISYCVQQTIYNLALKTSMILRGKYMSQNTILGAETCIVPKGYHPTTFQRDHKKLLWYIDLSE